MQNKTETSSDKGCPKGNRYVNILLIIVGSISVALGVLGIFLPVLPTTPFLLLAAACYAKSSSRFYCWLLNNRYLGKYIENYRIKKGLPLKLKVYVISLLWITILISIVFFIDPLVIKILLFLIAIGVTIHISSIKTLRE